MDFAKARLNMVQNQVAPHKVFDKRILEAMLWVPRHEFVSRDWQPVAYLDRRLPLNEEREMMQANSLARMLQLAEITDRDTVLEIACGSGYSTAILCQLADYVVGIDSIPVLVNQAALNLDKLGLKNFALRANSLLSGAAELAPFNVIMINGILPSLATSSILKQLAKGGRLVCVEMVEGIPRAVCYLNTGHSLIGRSEHFEVYAPVLGVNSSIEIKNLM